MRDLVQTWLEHIRYLAEEIGPRGPTTDGERRGAEYCAQKFHGLGLDARIEEFTSARSIFHPHLIAAGAMLFSFVLYPLGGQTTALIAALLAATTLVSELLELSFMSNPLRWIIPKGPSQNVVTQVPPAGEHERDLVLIGHLDTQRTPVIFSTARWLEAYKLFTIVAFVVFLLQVVLFVVGSVTQWAWIWPASIPSAIAAVLLAAMNVQAELTPFTAGANDNASAAGLLLTLAEELQDRPLERTRVWLACTGCEEVQHYGAIDFFRRHRMELRDPAAIAFEMLGCAGPSWLISEGIVVPFHADRKLVALAERVSRERPDLCAYPSKISGGNSEMADALRLGIPAISIGGATPTGGLPYWHQTGDTFDKIDPEVLGRAYAFSLAYIHAIDKDGV